MRQFSLRTPDEESKGDVDVHRHSSACGCGVALDLGNGTYQVYNEEAFRYFVASECRRSRQSGRPFLLLLVDLQPEPRYGTPIGERLARALFSRLSLCLRETDILGWFRTGRMAGAVFTQVPGAEAPGVRERIQERVYALLHDAILLLPANRSLRVRLFQLPAPSRGDLKEQG